jgi:rod shape-determining protein MreC
MRSFFDLVIKFKDYVVFVALIIICFALISINSNIKLGGFRTIVVGSIGWFQDVFSWIPNPTALKNENHSIRELNLYLSGEVIRSRKAILENERYKNMLSLKDTSKLELIATEVIGTTSIEMRNYITINKGKSSGILEGMAARTDAGLVGWCVISNDKYSIIELINNRGVKLASRNQRNDVSGIIEWTNDDYFTMYNIPDSYDIKPGDVLITSNYSAKYPPNIPIGRVAIAEPQQGSLFKKVKVMPLANLLTLEQVFIIKAIADSSSMQLIKDLENKLQQRKGSK